MRNNFFVYWSITLFTIFLLSIPFSQSFASPDLEPVNKKSLLINSDKQFEFAEHYFSKKEYFRAIGEYKRFIYFFPEDTRVELAMFRTGMSYFHGKHYTEAIDSFQALIHRYNYTNLSIQSYFMISESHVKLKAYGSAIINLQNLIAVTDDKSVRDKAYYKIGWIYIEMASWEQARQYFAKISAQNKNKYKLERLDTELDKEKLIPKKHPRLAGLFSIIPGAGFLYCERYQDALIAFLLNGGLMYAAYESFDNGQEALGGVIAFVEIGFYTGNIFGSITSAHKYNRIKTNQFIEKLKNNTKVNLSADMKKNGICLSFQYIF